MKVSGKINLPKALRPGETHWYPLKRGVGRTRSRSRHYENLLSLPESEPRFFCRSSRSPVTLPDHKRPWSVANHYSGNGMQQPRNTTKYLSRYRRRSGRDPNPLTCNSDSLLPTGWTELRRQMLLAIHGCLLTWNESLSGQYTRVRWSDSSAQAAQRRSLIGPLFKWIIRVQAGTAVRPIRVPFEGAMSELISLM